MMTKGKPYTATRYSIIALLVAIWLPSGLCAAVNTQLHSIRFGSHPGFTRVVLDVQGDRPVRVGPAASGKIEIDFKRLTTKVRPAALPVNRFPYVSAVRFEKVDGMQRVTLLLKQNTSVDSFFLDYDPPTPGWYRLVMDFSKGAVQQNKAVDETPPPKPSEPVAAKPEQPVRKPAEQQMKPDPSPVRAEKKASTPPPSNGETAPSSVFKPVGDNPFHTADANFLKHQDDLSKHALEIAQQYEDAIRSNPGAPEVALALYRCALAHMPLGDKEKARQYFRKVISSYPEHRVTPLCWLELGRLQLEDKNYVEAIEAIRTALSFPIKQSDKVEAYYLLGRSFSSVGAHQDAVEHFSKCLAMDPKCYSKHPDLLKFLGESLFAQQQYQDSCRYLLHYLNLQEDNAGRDLTLARIAEALNRQGEHGLSEKLYSYIEKQYPDSEGFIISQIRKAESLEEQNPEDAHKIYQKLAEYPLSVPLMKLVTFKLASWEWQHQNYGECLQMIDGIIRGRVNAAEYDEFLTLRQKVVTDWTMRSFANKDYIKVIQLYRDHKPLFQSQAREDLYTAIAESYAQMQLYDEAITIYQNMAASIDPRKDDWLVRIAQYSYFTGNLDKAEEYLSQVHDQAQESQKAQLLIEINFARGNHQQAVRQFEKLVQDKGDSTRIDLPVLLHYAESLIKTNRHKDALACLDKLDKRVDKGDSEQKVRVCLLKSECYQTLKELPKAVAVLEEAIALTASEELKNQFNYQLSKLYAESGQVDKATETLSHLLESSQPFWKNVAQQELNHLQLQGSVTTSNPS